MPYKSSKPLCLAMLVRDEAPVIERCLQSVLPFINRWIIFDTGSSDATQELIHKLLGHLPGHLESHPLDNFSDARNQLLARAAPFGGLVLMMDADEELQLLTDTIELPIGADVGLADIHQKGAVIRQARLFDALHLPRFDQHVHEHTSQLGDTAERVEGLVIKHHQDGIAHRDLDIRAQIRAKLIEANSASSDNDVTLYGLAELELKQGNTSRALELFVKLSELHRESRQYWMANYLAANIQLVKGNTHEACAFYEACIESDPLRIEPILRLAEVHQAAGDINRAAELCKLIVDAPVPALADYYEPAAYHYQAKLLLADLSRELNDPATAKATLASLIENFIIPSEQRQQIDSINQWIASTDNHDNAPSNAQNATKEVAKSPAITVGMATYDDYDGVYFSMMSVVLYHQEVLNDLEILVIDNNPSSAHGAAVKTLCNRVPQARYVEAAEYQGTTIRDRVFAEAKGEIVICMDCHVFLHQGSLDRLLKYYRANSEQRDLYHGPLFYDNHTDFSTHMEPRWNAGFFGVWGTDPRGADIDNDAFEIELQGMGLFACAKHHWLGFNDRFRGFGGEEGYIQEKFRQAGGKAMCLPFLRWTHRFDRPNGVQYANRWEDRIRNYLIGWSELELDLEPVLKHFAQNINFDSTARVHASVRKEQRGPLWRYDTIYVLAATEQDWEYTLSTLQHWAIDRVAQRITSPSDLSRLLKIARARGLQDVVFINGEEAHRTNLDRLIELIVEHADDSVDVLAAQAQDTQEPSALVVRQAQFQRVSEQLDLASHRITEALSTLPSVATHKLGATKTPARINHDAVAK